MVELEFFQKSLGGQSGHFCAFAFGRPLVSVRDIPYRHKATTLALSLESFFLLSSTNKVEIDIISYLCSKHVGEVIWSDM